MWAWVELNHRHPRYKRGALTPELHAHLRINYKSTPVKWFAFQRNLTGQANWSDI